MTEKNEVLGGAQLVEALRLGERQAHGPLAVFPLRAGRRRAAPATSRCARPSRGGRPTITEVSEGGSVPELRVVNKGDARILVLDGEELRGAKQNRVLNTTILIGGHSSLVVPVSCTEQGRWSYASREFAESEIVADRQVRYAMKESINAALRRGVPVTARTRARVWHEVERAARAGTRRTSPTGAMRDAYQLRKVDLDAVLAAFPLQDGQQGVLVLHGARVVGLDLVSRAPQYAELHDKLLRSYAFEALVRDGEPGDRAVADAFLERIADLPGRRYKSPGLGWDVRYEGGGVLGSALTYRGHAVHAAFFDVGGVRGASDQGGPGGDTQARASRSRTGASPTRASAPAGARRADEEETMDKDKRDRAYKAAAHITREQLRRDDPERARALDEVEQSDVVVVAGQYDHVESVLRALDVPHVVVGAAERRAGDAAARAAAHRQLPGPRCRRRPSRRIRRVRRGRRQPVHHRLGAQARDRAGVSRGARLRQGADARRRGAHRGARRREHLPAGRARRPGRPAVVARGVVVPHQRGRRGAGRGAHHQPRAGRAVRRASGGGVVPLGRGRRVPHDQPLLPAAHGGAHRAPRGAGGGLLRREGRGDDRGPVRRTSPTSVWPTWSPPSRPRRS